MGWIRENQISGEPTSSVAMDIMNVLDILKNQDLYQSRLKELHDATRALTEGKYIAATMKEAQTLVDAARATKEVMEQEIKDKRDQLAKERTIQENTIASEYSELRKEQQIVKEMKKDLEKKELNHKQNQDSLINQKEELNSFRKTVAQKEIEAEEKYQHYAEKVRQLQAIIN